ncbi:hypothetical protein T09_2654 [Trichinella sp. T9]|nr:hypothetical protein T09_2654 [Trichinella sp. T9]
MPTFSALHWLFVDGIVGESKSVEKEKDTLGALFGTIHAAEQKGGGKGREKGGGNCSIQKLSSPAQPRFSFCHFDKRSFCQLRPKYSLMTKAHVHQD